MDIYKLRQIKKLHNEGMSIEEISAIIHEQIYEVISAGKTLNIKFANKKEEQHVASKGSKKLYDLLTKIFPSFNIEKEYSIGERSRLDYYIKDFNVGIEFDGRQHFEYVQHFHSNKDGFKKQQILDEKKNEICALRDISVIRFSDDDDLTVECVKGKILTALKERRKK